MALKDKEPQRINSVEANRLTAIANLEAYLERGEEGILREDQQPVMGALQKFYSDGETAGTIVRPPRSGKTVITARIIDVLKLNTVVISPTNEILDKTKKTIEKYAPGVTVSNYDAKSKDVSGKVINTTLASAEKVAAIKPVADNIQLVIVDEVDFGTLGHKRHELWRKFPNALFIGLTATDDFSQIHQLQQQGQVSMGERWTGMYTHNIHEMTREEAQEADAMTPLDIHLVKTNAVVGKIKVRKGEYDDEELDRLLNIEARNVQVLGLLAGVSRISSTLSAEQRLELQDIHQKIKGKRTMVFGLNIKHVEVLAARLRKLGISAEAVHGKMDRDRQKEIIEAHRAGRTQVLLGVDLIGRGLDSPATEVGIYMRPRKTDTALIQEVGRIVGVSEETGKERATAVQLIDTYERPEDIPILIPEIIDPDYILKGKRRLGTSGRQGVTTDKEAIVTVSGMEIETLEEFVMQAQMRKRIETAGSLEEMNAIFDEAISMIRPDSENQSIVKLYKRLASTLPSRISSEVQRFILKHVTNQGSTDGVTDAQKKLGQKAFLLLNMKSILSTVQPYFSANSANNDEILQTAIVQILERVHRMNPARPIPEQIWRILHSGQTVIYAAEQDEIPRDWLDDKKASEILTTINRHLIRRQKVSGLGLAENEIDSLAYELHEATGYDFVLLRDIVATRHDRMFGQKDVETVDTTAGSLLKAERNRAVHAALRDITSQKVREVTREIDADIKSAKAFRKRELTLEELDAMAIRIARTIGYDLTGMKKVVRERDMQIAISGNSIPQEDAPEPQLSPDEVNFVAEALSTGPGNICREEIVLEMLFGFDPDVSRSNRVQIGQRIGVSRERVAQIEARGLNRLRWGGSPLVQYKDDDF